MHFFLRNFNEIFNNTHRLVFDNPPSKGNSPAAAPQGAPPEDETKPKVRPVERDKSKAAATAEVARIEQEKLKDYIDESGEPKEYVETFKNSEKFAVLAANLEEGMRINDPDSFFDYRLWPVIEPQDRIACLFESQFFPSGKGKKQFLDGLRTQSPKDDDKSPEAEKARATFKESHEALRQIVKDLDVYFEKKRSADVDVQKQAAKHPLGETLGTGVKTMMDNFHKGSGTEKMLMLGAVGIAIGLIMKYKDRNFLWSKTMKWSDAMWGMAAFWGVNYLSGKVAPDGRTLTQRLGVLMDIDDLREDSDIRAFAEKNGLRENQRELTTLIHTQRVDVKRLFQLYREASLTTTTKKSIDPAKVGLPRGKRELVNGEDLYDIIHNLVRETAINEGVRREREKRLSDSKKPGGKPFVEPKPSDFSEEQLKAMQEPGNAIASFHNKYITGELGETNQTLFDAIVNEYRTQDAAAIIRQKKGETLAMKAYDSTKRGLEIAGDYAKRAGNWIWDKGGDVVDFTREKAVAFGGWTATQWNHYYPKGKEAVLETIGWRERQAMSDKKYLDKVLPANFDVDVKNAGTAFVKGFPVQYELRRRRDGKDIAIIDHVQFVLDDGFGGGNVLKISQLDANVRKHVDGLIKEKAKTAPLLSGKNFDYDSAKHTWILAGVPFASDPLLPFVAAGTKDLTFEVSEEGKALAFALDKVEVNNFSKLDETNRTAEVQKRLWADARFGKQLDGLEVTVDGVTSDATYGAVVKGKIAGLEFHAVPSLTTAGALDFFDAATITAGDASLLKITASNGGAEFLRAKSALILSDGAYLNPFFKLEALMDNTSDSALSRLKELFPTTKWGVIPTSLNVPGVLSGKILQREWKFMLDYKKMETLDFFQHELLDPGTRSVADIQAAYDGHIKTTIDHLEGLARDIAAVRPDEERAKRFQEYLHGPGKPGTTQRFDQYPGLEYVNYTNNDYQKLYEEYRRMVQSYDFEGLDSIKEQSISIGAKEWGAADNAFKINETLMRVWSVLTRGYSKRDPHPDLTKIPPQKVLKELSADSQRGMRDGVIMKVRDILEQIKQREGGIKLAALPAHATEEDIYKWADPTYIHFNRGIKAIP